MNDNYTRVYSNNMQKTAWDQDWAVRAPFLLIPHALSFMGENPEIAEEMVTGKLNDSTLLRDRDHYEPPVSGKADPMDSSNFFNASVKSLGLDPNKTREQFGIPVEKREPRTSCPPIPNTDPRLDRKPVVKVPLDQLTKENYPYGYTVDADGNVHSVTKQEYDKTRDYNEFYQHGVEFGKSGETLRLPNKALHPAFVAGYFAGAKNHAKRMSDQAATATKVLDYATIGVGAAGETAARFYTTPYDLPYLLGGKYLGMPPLRLSEYEDPIDDARRDLVERYGHPSYAGDAAYFMGALGPAILNWKAWGAIGAKQSLPSWLSKGIRVTRHIEPFLQPAERLAEQGAIYAMDTHKQRYSPLSIRLRRIPLMEAEVNRLVTEEKMPLQQAREEVAKRVLAQMQRSAVALYPDDKEKQEEYVRNSVLNMVRAGDGTFSSIPLSMVGVSPQEGLEAVNEGAMTGDAYNKTRWLATGPQALVTSIVGAVDRRPSAMGKAVGSGNGYMNVVPSMVEGMYSVLSKNPGEGQPGMDANVKTYLKGYFSGMQDNPEKLNSVFSALGTGLAEKYDLDSMKLLLAQLQKLGKNINWEDYGLTPEQGQMAMQHIERAFKDRAVALWKQDIFGNTPKLVSLWLRNMGLSEAIADIVENPWAFYGGGLLLLLGGGAIVGSAVGGGGGENEDPGHPGQRAIRSPYDEGYTQFARTRLAR